MLYCSRKDSGRRRKQNFFVLSKSELGRNQANFDLRIFKYHLILAFCFHKKYQNKQTLAFINPKMGGSWGWGVVVQKKRSCTWKTGLKDKVLSQPDQPINFFGEKHIGLRSYWFVHIVLQLFEMRCNIFVDFLLF
jgi:hypothetical protein